jgi:oligosaccharyltransferase complex subunit gamma
MIFILVGVVALVIFSFYGLKPIFNNPTVWLLGSLLIYTICIAGVVFNIIHGIPFTTTDSKGNLEWKSNQGR